MSVFGAVMKDIRDVHGLSQHGLADLLESTQRHVSFVETGRSAPTEFFVTRLCRALNLSLAERANLFDAAGLPSIYGRRDPNSTEVRAALDLIDTRVLRHWPFPAIVLDPGWAILRSNKPFRTVFAPFLPGGNAPQNLLDIMLVPEFRGLITNWDQASELIYYRLQASAARHADAAEAFVRAKASGMFEAMPKSVSADQQAPVFVPLRLALPGGPALEMTSVVGRLATVLDCLVEGFEIEFFVPCDSLTEATMLARSGAP